MNQQNKDFNPMDYQGRSKKQVESSYKVLQIWSWMAAIATIGVILYEAWKVLF